MRQPVIGFFAQILVLAFAFRAFKNRQQRINILQDIIAAFGDIDRIGRRFRQIGKQRHHFGRGFQTLVGRIFFPIVISHIFAFGDTNQSIVRFIHIGIKEKSFVGRYQRDIVLISQINKVVFGFGFFFRTYTGNFHI